MPSKQIKTGIPFLQKVNSDINNIPNANNIVLGRNNNINNTNNLIIGDGNSTAGNVQVIGSNNILNQSTNSLVLGNDNFILSNNSFIVGSSNSVSDLNNNVVLMGVSNLNLTQSISDVFMVGQGAAPTQSGIYFNQNVNLGPNVSIVNDSGNNIEFDSNGVFINSSNNIETLAAGDTNIISVGSILISSTNNDIVIDANDNMLLQTGAIGLLEIVTNAEDDFRFNTYAFKEIVIGDWNMNYSASGNLTVLVAHNLSSTEWKTIRCVDVMIRDDGDVVYLGLMAWQGSYIINNTDFQLYSSVTFDDNGYDATSFNRGWIRFQYKPD